MTLRAVLAIEQAAQLAVKAIVLRRRRDLLTGLRLSFKAPGMWRRCRLRWRGFLSWLRDAGLQLMLGGGHRWSAVLRRLIGRQHMRTRHRHRCLRVYRMLRHRSGVCLRLQRLVSLNGRWRGSWLRQELIRHIAVNPLLNAVPFVLTGGAVTRRTVPSCLQTRCQSQRDPRLAGRAQRVEIVSLSHRSFSSVQFVSS